MSHGNTHFHLCAAHNALVILRAAKSKRPTYVSLVILCSKPICLVRIPTSTCVQRSVRASFCVQRKINMSYGNTHFQMCAAPSFCALSKPICLVRILTFICVQRSVRASFCFQRNQNNNTHYGNNHAKLAAHTAPPLLSTAYILSHTLLIVV